MEDGLVDALERVHLGTNALPSNDDAWIDQMLDEQRPRQQTKQDAQDLKRELEQKYLTPSTTFSTDWLNKLQQ